MSQADTITPFDQRHPEYLVASQFSRTTRSLAKDTSLLAIVTWSFALVLLMGWLGWFFWGQVTVYEPSRKARLEVQRSSHPVSSVVSGKVLSNSLVLGQDVIVGDVLIRLDSTPDELRMSEELSRLAAIDPKIESLNKEISALVRAGVEAQMSAAAMVQAARFRIDEATTAADFAKDNEQRMKEESSVGGIAQIEALRARSESQKLDSARAAMGSDLSRIEIEAKIRSHQQFAEIENLRRTVVTLEGERATTSAIVARLKQEIDQHIVRAPASGKIGEIATVGNGSFVTVGQRLATVIPQGQLIVVADFNPASVLGRIHPGQSGRMRLDGFPWTEFGSLDARVTRVASEIRDQFIRVEFTLEPEALARPYLQHGLPGSIEVSVERTSPMLLILRAVGQLQLSTEYRPQTGTANVPNL